MRFDDICAQEEFGDGHILTLTHDVGAGEADDGAVTRLVTAAVPGAALQRAGGGELAFRLPAAASASFPDLLDQLQLHGASLAPLNTSVLMYYTIVLRFLLAKA